jgi:uncharacterized caspase-like protein
MGKIIDDFDLKKYYGNSYCIIIGISKYKQENDLPNAKNDANAIVRVLEEQYGFANLIPPLFNENATEGKIREVFVDIIRDKDKVGPRDRLLIYYSGHGKLRTW